MEHVIHKSLNTITMKSLTAIILTALLSFASGLYFPWWSIAVVALLVAVLVHQKAGKAFLSGFLAIFLLWGILAFWIDVKNEHLLSQKVAQIFPLGGSHIAMILVTAVVGALVGGFAAMTGSYLRSKK
jgi:apolipoprotein N-acyltransferase